MRRLLTFTLWLNLNWSVPSQMPNIKKDGYNLYRMDRDSHGGGVIIYINSDIISRLSSDSQFKDTENISVELCMGKTKWAATWQNQQNDSAPSEDSDQPGHPPSLIRVVPVRMKKAWVLSYPLSAQRRLWSDWADVQADMSLGWVHTHFVGFIMTWLIYQPYNNIILLGDLNLYLIDQNNGRLLRDVCDIVDLQNLIKTTTRFMKDSNPSLVNVILTNEVYENWSFW